MPDDARSKILARRARFLMMALAGAGACDPKAPDPVTPPLPPASLDPDAGAEDASAPPELPRDASPSAMIDHTALAWSDAAIVLEDSSVPVLQVRGRVNVRRLKPPAQVFRPPPGVCLSIAMNPIDSMLWGKIRPDVTRCYDKVLATSPSQRGAFTLVVDVDPNGLATHAKVKDVDGGVDPTILACSITSARSINKWAQGAHGKTVEVRVELQPEPRPTP